MTQPDGVFLSADWAGCERGNNLFTNDEQLVAWLHIEGDWWLEVSHNPGNYPALNVGPVLLSKSELVAHINAKLGGWFARKCNLAGVQLGADGRVREPEDDEDDDWDEEE